MYSRSIDSVECHLNFRLQVGLSHVQLPQAQSNPQGLIGQNVVVVGPGLGREPYMQ